MRGTIRLHADRYAPSRARAFVSKLGEDPAVVQLAQLAVSEFVTAAVRRHHGTVEITVRTSPEALRVELRSCPEAAAGAEDVPVAVPDPSAPELQVVDAVCDRWAVLVDGSDPIMWCEWR
jgi:hypothetical protein